MCPCCPAGGWLQGGDAGNLKLTLPTAFTTSMLAWGLVAFPSGYKTETSRAKVCRMCSAAASLSCTCLIV